MILGFGNVEIETAHKIIDECRAAIESNPKNAEQAIKSVKKKYDDEEKRLSAMNKQDAPERYTHFWFTYHSIYEGKYIIEFTFHHINRRHALSPDGWALLGTRWILTVDEGLDEIYVFKEA